MTFSPHTLSKELKSHPEDWQVYLQKALGRDSQDEKWLSHIFELLDQQQEIDMRKEAVELISQCPETLIKLDVPSPVDKQWIEETLENEDINPACFIMKSGLGCPKNQAKNRYRNVLPWDRTRVVLRRTLPESSHITKQDYINANHIYINRYSDTPLSAFESSPVFQLPHQIPYIATQAPLQCSEADFYQMMWEQGSHAIVTLANTEEGGRMKGFPYWEQSKQLVEYHPVPSPSSRPSIEMISCLAPLSVTLVSETIPFHGCVVRELQLVSHVADPHIHHNRRRVIQIHYTHWPDFGVAPLKDMLNLIQLARQYYEEDVQAYQDHVAVSCDKGPMVTHCSAGIGRTGVFIAVDAIVRCLSQPPLHPIQHSVESTLDLVTWTVAQLRRQRCGMVQTAEQLACIYNTVMAVYHQKI